MLGLFIVLLIVGWFYDRARKRNNIQAKNIIIGIASLFIGVALANVFIDLFIRDVFPDSIFGEIVIGVSVVAVFIFVTYRVLKNILNPTVKKVDSPTLDGDLMDSKPDEQKNP